MAGTLTDKKSVKWAFLLPALAYLALMAVLPLVWTLTLSLTKWHANTMPKPV
jgi:ABC-type sugar transport system permease subunit